MGGLNLKPLWYSPWFSNIPLMEGWTHEPLPCLQFLFCARNWRHSRERVSQHSLREGSWYSYLLSCSVSSCPDWAALLASRLASDPALHTQFADAGACSLAWPYCCIIYGFWCDHGSPTCELRALSSSFLPSLPQPTCFNLQGPYGPPRGSWNHLWIWVALYSTSLPPAPYMYFQHKWGKHNAHTHQVFLHSPLPGQETTIQHLPDS